MSTQVSLSRRDLSLLRFLSWTPALTSQLLRASIAFEGDPFADERRLRERLQALGAAGAVRSWATAHQGGGLEKYFKLTALGFGHVYGTDAEPPPRAFLAEVSPSLLAHTFRLAEVIADIVRTCHLRRITIERFMRENELPISVGDECIYPDCFLRLATAGRAFNLALEIDNSTESLDSHAVNSIRRKLTVYHAYQERVLAQWLAGGKKWEKPRFRVVFLTQSVARAYHILALAAETTERSRRRLVYAAALDAFTADPDPLFAPLFLDHRGEWQALVNLHPTTAYAKTPVRLALPVESPLGVW